ncbi:MAG TPA: agmatine deiminase family protein [Gammaproteobacteria bacterium]
MATPYPQYLPPEWYPQSGVLLTWPHAHSHWRDLLSTIEATFLDLAAAIARYETVVIACYDEGHRHHVRQRLTDRGVPMTKVRLYVAPSNDIWTRDHGPLTVLHGAQPLLLDFQFNGWGGKWPYQLDDALTAALHTQGAYGTTPRQAIELILEGGSIEVDGEGTLLTTSQCLLDPLRNPQFDRPALEKLLGAQLGLRRVLWLDHGHLLGDDTDGHIDTLARFCDPHTIAYVKCEQPDDPHFAPLQAMERHLREFVDYQGNPYRLVPLPLPAPQFKGSERLPATYANFLIINGAVLVPTYGDPLDKIALERLADCFPGREIIGIHAVPIIQFYGSLHCVTMQLPMGVL